MALPREPTRTGPLDYRWLQGRVSVGSVAVMPGHFGSSETTDDGGYAETQSSGHVGFFGNNTSQQPSAGGAGGSGVFGLTVSPNSPGVFGANNGPSGVGVQGNGAVAGISGFSDQGNGLRGFSNGGDGLYVATQSSAHSAVFGNNQGGATAAGGGAGGAGVFGLTVTANAAAVLGANNGSSGSGVQGNGPTAGISGFSEQGFGLLGHSNHNDGAQIYAHDAAHNGVLGLNTAPGPAPTDGSPVGNGVYGYTDVSNASGVVGAIPATNTAGAGITAFGPTAGRFYGDVAVTGTITVSGDVVLAGGSGDVAEDFLVTARDLTPGTVLCITDDEALQPSQRAYDTRVAGVISGAGGYRPGMVLNRTAGRANQAPIALTGRVYCQVEADSAPIGVGDLLTTSAVTGHAMRAVPVQGAGAILGKALRAVAGGRALIPILVCLQ